MQYLDLKSKKRRRNNQNICAVEKTVHYNDISRSFQPISLFHRLRQI